jgi:hypothetical protein
MKQSICPAVLVKVQSLFKVIRIGHSAFLGVVFIVFFFLSSFSLVCESHHATAGIDVLISGGWSSLMVLEVLVRW